MSYLRKFLGISIAAIGVTIVVIGTIAGATLGAVSVKERRWTPGNGPSRAASGGFQRPERRFPGRSLVPKKKNIETRARSAQMWRIYGVAASLIGWLRGGRRRFPA